MEKNWFIFENDHHVGPFTAQDIVNMHIEGRVKNDTMVWREGEADWQRYSLCQELDLDLLPELPPLPPGVVYEEDLPPLPAFDEELSMDANELAPIEVEIEAQPEIAPETRPEEEVEIEVQVEAETEVPEIPIGPDETPSFDRTEDLAPELDDDNDWEESTEPKFVPVDGLAIEEDGEVGPTEDEYEEDEEGHEVEWVEDLAPMAKQTLPWARWVLSAASCLAILASLYFIVRPMEDRKQFRGVARDDLDKLIKISKTPNKGKPLVQLALTRNQDELWLSSNYAGPTILFLTMRSKKNRVLSPKEVVVTSEALLENHAAHFDELRLISGDQLAKGEYDVEIKAMPTGLLHRLYRVLRKLGIPKFWKGAEKLSSSFNYKNSALLYSGNEEKFKKDLDTFMAKRKKVETGPLKSRLEFYRTLIQLLKRTQEIYSNTLKSIRKGRDIQTFEREFGTQVSPMLQGIVISTNEKYASLMGKDQRASKEYGKLLEFGKSVGGLAAEMVVETRKYRNLKKRTRTRLEENFKKRTEELRLEGELHMKGIQSKIEQF